MAPRVPSHDEHSVVDVDDKSSPTASRATNFANGASKSSTSFSSTSNAADDVSKMLTPATAGDRWCTFHHELNVYSVLALYLLAKYVVPENIMKIVLALLSLDCARYYYCKGSMAGVPYTMPFVSLLAMIIRPNRMWEELATISMRKESNGMCFTTLAGLPLVFLTSPDLCREAMTTEEDYGVYAHPNALWLFGPKNLIYMDPNPHKKFRAILTPALFSSEALTQYSQVQERVVERFLGKWAKTQEPINAMLAFRSMAAASSQESFLGPYLTDEMREHLEKDIMTFTMGFLCVPFPYFNTGLHQAIQAKNRIEHTIRSIVPQANDYVINKGNKPRCMIEHWSLAIWEAAKAQGLDHPQDVAFCDDENLARTVLDFLFAAQDATNSGLTYALDVLDAHRDTVLDRMRKEVKAAMAGGQKDADAAVAEIWTKLRDDPDTLAYTAKVANQLLHHKPPVPMIPHLAKKSTYLGGHWLAPQTIVIPSITYSARVNGMSLEFLPEREDHDSMFVKTFTFGAGQHKCPGRRYAESLLKVFLCVLAKDYDFERPGKRPTADDFIYFPTIFPADSMFVIKPYNNKDSTAGCTDASAAATSAQQ